MTWAALKSETGATIVDLMQSSNRAARFQVQADGMLFDYAKTSMTETAREALLQLAADRGVAERRDAMFTGEPINETEGRSVLHVALRAGADAVIKVDGQDVMPGVRDVLSRMRAFADDVRSGRHMGAGGPITDVVNIGIGGSHLGPEMCTLALRPYHEGPRCHFVSNVDGADIADCLDGLEPKTTLFIVASKTFTTIETMTNAETAKAWVQLGGGDLKAQFSAVSTAHDKTEAFGIAPERVFGFADWVGGRYSIWGPIGLSLMLAVGSEEFDAFLAGGASMDAHFRTTPLERNMPVMLALTGLWHSHACGYPTRAVLPYDQRLLRLPAYFQQLEMESNGKGVTKQGDPVEGGSGPIVWGEPGTNGQHAFYQLIHQGTQVVPCEFMVAAWGGEPGMDNHHRLLIANCLAQSEALMRGRDIDTARDMMRKAGFEGAELERQAAHRVFPGNRPSTTLVYDRLTPYRLGQIIALYEHRVFVEGVILGINSFDQWGVELGKELAKEMEPLVAGEAALDDKDSSTQNLLAFLKAIRG
ncbi:Glucose-6-phosphate isomerase [Roseovarius sp. THAF9]|uniref:glucose-6-phosphate isomerase n=1 Tax=Roseovarius sp. THAF9 TaxID=2587847 RepID=UPI0012695B41|nr:glucose-6-phosphate isomerase [Roseovarius sp. THAF9]QFT93116.1 Glucose-6-phosphate isomerase [Roseovarius sp. THAF9]